MKRVLFVDDDPRVLDGLRRMLHSMRREWQMDFAEGGQQALERLAASPYDAVVSDMRMPHMDGSEFLHEVLRRYPATVRIVLSGQCDRQTVLRAVEPTHQFLSKPCDPEILKTTLLRACQCRDRLNDDEYKRIVSRVTSVPSLPEHYQQLLAELQSPDASLRRIGEIIGQDIGMAAKIMQLIHTSFFGTPQSLADPMRAASLFDLETLRALALSTHVFSPFSEPSVTTLHLKLLFDHSLAVAITAREIARAESRDAQLADQAYLAGLLHDLGLLILAHSMPESCAAIVKTASENRTGICQAESQHLHESHASIGAYLMALWGLPDEVVQAIAFHHCPADAGSSGFTPLTAIHVANSFCAEEAMLADAIGGATDVDLSYLQSIGLSHRLEAWRAAHDSLHPEEVAR